MLSTLDKSLAQDYIRAGHTLRRELAVPVRSVDSILEESDLRSRLSMAIDIEGHEVDALKSMNISSMETKLILHRGPTCRRRDQSLCHRIFDLVWVLRNISE